MTSNSLLALSDVKRSRYSGSPFRISFTVLTFHSTPTERKTRILNLFFFFVDIVHATYPLWYVSTISITRCSCWLMMLTACGLNCEWSRAAGCISISLLLNIYINGYKGLVTQHVRVSKRRVHVGENLFFQASTAVERAHLCKHTHTQQHTVCTPRGPVNVFPNPSFNFLHVFLMKSDCFFSDSSIRPPWF